MPRPIPETEVFVAGAGPAGLAAALAVRQAGFDVIVADCSHPPIDKACGEGIMPDGLAALARLGVQLEPSEGAPFAGIRFVNGSRQVEASFSEGAGIGVRRTLLHQRLVDAAAEAGIRLLWDRNVTGLADNRVSLGAESLRCRWVIGADGQSSRIRRLAGLDSFYSQKLRFGFRKHYRVVLPPKSVEVHWSDCGQMYVTPVGDETVCVALITAHKQLRFDDAIGHFPELSSRLRNAVAEDSERGAVTATRKLRKVHSGKVALIGEAAGSVDAITGEGLAIAFRQAAALAAALQADDLSLYEAAHHSIMRLPHAMAALTLTMDRRPRFRDRVFCAFEAQQEIFARMLAIHIGAVSPMNFGIGNTLSLGWHLLTAKP